VPAAQLRRRKVPWVVTGVAQSRPIVCQLRPHAIGSRASPGTFGGRIGRRRPRRAGHPQLCHDLIAAVCLRGGSGVTTGVSGRDLRNPDERSHVCYWRSVPTISYAVPVVSPSFIWLTTHRRGRD
jgi:hypothetical protein